MAVEFDEKDRRDSEALLQAFCVEVRGQVESNCRAHHYHYTRHEHPTDEEFEKIVDEAVESEMFDCGRKLARLLMKGID
jgi:hypothetical protein